MKDPRVTRGLQAPGFRLQVVGVALVVGVGVGTGWAQQPVPSPAPEVNPRVITTEVPIVGGNAASAKQRAMDDAFRQAVERSFAALLAEAGIGPGEALPPALNQLRAAFISRSRRYLRSYRVLEQGEQAGRYRISIDAEVDEGMLRREIDRARGGAAVPVAGPRAAGRGSAVVAGTPPEGTLALARALGAAGVKADAPPLGSASESQVQQVAARSGAAAVLLSGQVAGEGPVRGTSKTAAFCKLQARVLPAGGGPAADRAAETRAFADGDPAAREECLSRVAADLARQIADAIAPASAAAPVAGRAVTLELDLVEPAALPLVLRALKKVGTVSSAEVRRVVVGSVEIRAVTRLAAAALAAALARELSGAAAVVVGPAQPDRVSVQVRLNAGAAPLPPAPPAGSAAIGPQ
jgi:hypothetical protein